jgi:hypothetical protein
MAFNFAVYDAATRPAQGEAPGARVLMNYCLGRWSFASDLGIFDVRNVVGGDDLSHHAEGRALDVGIPMLDATTADAAKGMQIIDALGPSAQRLGIDHLIYNRTIWSRRSPAGRPYVDPDTDPHLDHIHVGLTGDAGATLSSATVESVLGSGGQPPRPVTEQRVTHRVTASSLRLRREPSLSAAVIARLIRDSFVEQLGDPARTNDGHTWFKVRAATDVGVHEGWVASEHLQATGAAPDEPRDQPGSGSEPGPTPVGATTTVRRNEGWVQVAERVFGDHRRAAEIKALNPPPDRTLQEGDVLRLPA